MERGDEGVISKWNEGDLKNLRLHDAQVKINDSKVNPFSYSHEFMNWNYLNWKGGIDVLFGEGMSKYSDTEVEEVVRIKNIIETFLELRTPFKKIYGSEEGKKIEKFIPVKEDQHKIKEYLELYEKIVKKYNDAHGLSTGNIEVDVKGL